MPFFSDIRLGGEFLEEKSRIFENSLKLPMKKDDLVTEFDKFLKDSYETVNMELTLRSVSYCNEEEKRILLDCEIL